MLKLLLGFSLIFYAFINFMKNIIMFSRKNLQSDWLGKRAYCFADVGPATLVGQRPMKSLSSVCLSFRLSPPVRLSVRFSLNILKIGSLVKIG